MDTWYQNLFLFSLSRLLGDHKQLSPLVLASGGDREIKDKSLGRSHAALLRGFLAYIPLPRNVDRSLMERAIDNNLRPHSLRVQYRMPEVLCNLVSSLFYGRCPSRFATRARHRHGPWHGPWLRLSSLEVALFGRLERRVSQTV